MTPPPGQVKTMGIDAALRSTGIGVVEQVGHRLRAVSIETVRNPRAAPHSACLVAIASALRSQVREHQPEAAAIEGGFFMKNARTAMLLGEVRGVVIAICSEEGLPVYEYAPRAVKQAVVGHGQAHKGQVNQMVVRLLGLTEAPQEDAGDALAVAIAHLHRKTSVAALSPEPL